MTTRQPPWGGMPPPVAPLHWSDRIAIGFGGVVWAVFVFLVAHSNI